MKPLAQDLSIFNKFKFKNPPVAVKFELFKPKGIKPLNKKLPACGMIGEAQKRGTPFYFTAEDEDCFGKVPLGWEDMPPWGEGGYLGEKFEIFQEQRANSRIYKYLPKFPRNTVNYIAMSTLDKLTFEPDLLILMATASQAEIVLRAMAYSTGEIYESKHAGVLGCAWMYVYPYQSGKINFMVTGLTFGGKAHEVFEEGWILIFIPYNWIPTIVQNLKEMKWTLPSYTDGLEKFNKRKEGYIMELAQKSENP
jgi:uncharacterized protein (DUF169 family)